MYHTLSNQQNDFPRIYRGRPLHGEKFNNKLSNILQIWNKQGITSVISNDIENTFVLRIFYNETYILTLSICHDDDDETSCHVEYCPILDSSISSEKQQESKYIEVIMSKIGKIFEVQLFTGISLLVMLPVIENFGSDLAKLWANQTMLQSEGKRIVVPYDLKFPEEDEKYIISAILTSTPECLCSFSYIQKLVKSTDSYGPIQAWTDYGPPWLQKIINSTIISARQFETLCFEAVCNNGQDCFQYRRKIQTCNTRENQCLFLIHGKYYNYPSGNNIFNDDKKPFREPASWLLPANKPRQVIELLNALWDFTRECKTSKINNTKQLFNKYPPTTYGPVNLKGVVVLYPNGEIDNYRLNE